MFPYFFLTHITELSNHLCIFALFISEFLLILESNNICLIDCCMPNAQKTSAPTVDAQEIFIELVSSRMVMHRIIVGPQ
jgi:hypothetical protein